MVERRSLPVDGPESPPASYGRENGCDGESGAVPTDVLLDILGDGYARRILGLLSDRPRTGRELTEQTDMSRPTVYRRLETLQEHGLVRSEMQFDPDGHHRKRFHATVDRFDFDVGNGTLSATVRPTEGEGTRHSG